MKISFRRSKIGLALGGGGAKGLAHLGVLKVLNKYDIKIDYIAGTSIGAIIGGLYAMDGEVGNIEKIVDSLDRKSFLSLYGIGLKDKGLISGNKLHNLLEELTVGRNIEDLKISFVAVASDIRNGKTVRLNSGSLSEAMRASSAIPLLLSPFKSDQGLLVDGGVSEPIPIETVKQMGADKVIAVNLDTDYFPEDINQDGKIGFLDIGNNTYNMVKMNLSYELCKQADLVLEPKVGDPGLMKFVDSQKLIQAGCEVAEANILNIKKLARRQLFLVN